MQGINILSPLAVRALLASAALFTGVSVSTIRAQTPKQLDQHEETSIPSEKFTSRNGNASFPRPLNPSDERRIRYIFDLQRKGDFKTAQSETIQISDNLLLGDILAERYLNPQFSPTTGQLKLWLKNFTSYADLPAILKRLNSLTTTKISVIIHQNNLTTSNIPTLNQFNSESKTFKRNPLLDRTIHERSNQGIKGAKSALRLIQKTPGMTILYAAQLQAEIAQQLFAINQSDFAFTIAKKAFTMSNHHIGLAGYIAGLIAWKNNHPDQAFDFFKQASQSDIITTNIRAGTFFWAARSKLRKHDSQEYEIWLRRSATFIHTFYGMLASHILKENNFKSLDAKFNHSRFVNFIAPTHFLTLTSVDINAIEATSEGKRFFALLQVNEKERAETVLRQIWIKNKNNLALTHSIQLVAITIGYHDLAQQLKDAITQNESHFQQNKKLPLPKLHPKNGYKINPALVYALIRLESNFNNKAISNTGAQGLMQIMPVTAKYIAQQQDNLYIHNPNSLQNTSLNLEIGQLYLIYLAELYNKKTFSMLPKGGSLIHMLASYNAGPTITSKWLNMPENTQDPLLFMESIPIKETKDYLHKAFTYLWIYSDKLDIPSPSLEALSHNQWPRFTNELKLAQAVTIH